MKLVKMNQDEYDFWIRRSIKNYAKGKVKANNLTEKEAKRAAKNDFLRLLPDGLKSKDNFLYSMREQKVIVGYIWFCIKGSAKNRKAFLCDIIIEKSSRSKGLGRSAMVLLEGKVKKLGGKEIGLHVFGFNQKAVRLYQSLGYQTTDLIMAKPL